MSSPTPDPDRLARKRNRGPAGDGYRVERFAASGVTDDQVLALWARHGHMGDDEARRRLAEVLMVGVHDTDGLVAVSTAYLQPHHQLRTDMWHYRALTAPDHRAGNLANAMFTDALALLAERYATGEDQRAPGVVLEIQNPELRRQFTEAGEVFVFIGEREQGAHIRVTYFDGATIPVP